MVSSVECLFSGELVGNTAVRIVRIYFLRYNSTKNDKRNRVINKQR